jgi:RNA polymerase sigma-70 factor (ECF subfamily)
VRTFRDRVWAMLLSRVGNRDTARDLLQEVLVSAWRALAEGRLRDPEKLGAFVYGIARNVINNRRRTAAAGPVEVPLTPELELAVQPPDFEDRERRRLVREAMALLEPSDRRVLLLTLVDNLRPREIARRLGVSSDVARTRKTRALKRFVERVRELSRTAAADHKP